jgi:hypothetical protein
MRVGNVKELRFCMHTVHSTAGLLIVAVSLLTLLATLSNALL